MMTDKIVNSTIEILGKFYPIRCKEPELKSLQQAAEYLNQKMMEVQDSGKVINLERIAIITALNITHQFLQLDQQKLGLVTRINQRITQLQDKLDTAIKTTQTQTEFYTTE
jgi:cell division protein ZapA